MERSESMLSRNLLFTEAEAKKTVGRRQETLELGRTMLSEAFHAPVAGSPDGNILLDEAFRLRNLSVNLESEEPDKTQA